LVLRPTQPPIQYVPGAPSARVKLPDHAADHSPPSNAEIKNIRLYLHPQTRRHDVVLNKLGTGAISLHFTIDYIWIKETLKNNGRNTEESRREKRDKKKYGEELNEKERRKEEKSGKI
jgi:hypothetical protein